MYFGHLNRVFSYLDFRCVNSVIENMKFYERPVIMFLSFVIACLYLKWLVQDYTYECHTGYSPSLKPCPNNGKDLKIIILIKSAPNNIGRRKTIRETWAELEVLTHSVKVAFVVGTRPNFLNIITQELEAYGDIILGHFIDTYHNLTLKGVHAFSWLNFFCREVPYVFYCNDNVYVNVSSLLTFLGQFGQTRNTIFGYVVVGKPPVRDVTSKYYVPEEKYPASVYPNYTVGAGYIVSGNLIPKICYAAAMSELFKLDDIFFTGLIARALNVGLVHVPEFCVVPEANSHDCLVHFMHTQPP